MNARATATRVTPNDVLRFFLELFSFVSLGIWGFLSWSFPLSIIFGVGAPVLAILLWALFRSPKAVFTIDLFGRSFIELLVMGAAVFAWIDLGAPLVGIAFGLLAVISGFVNARRELR